MLFRLAGMGLKAALPHLGKIGKVAETGLTVGGLGYGLNELISAPGKIEKRLAKEGPIDGEYKLQGLEHLLAPFVNEQNDESGIDKLRAKHLNETEKGVIERTSKGIREINPGESLTSYYAKTDTPYNLKLAADKVQEKDILTNTKAYKDAEAAKRREEEFRRNQIIFNNTETQRQFDTNVNLAREAAANKLEAQRQQLALDRLNLTSQIDRDKYNREQDRRDRRQALIASILGLGVDTFNR